MSGVFANLLGTQAQETRDGYQVLVDALRSNREAAGSDPVTPATSMKMAAVFACVRILSETVGSLPLMIYQRMNRGRRRAQEHYLYSLLHDRPNEQMTAFEYREAIESHLALWGNAYSLVDYDPRGRVERLWPLRPDRVLQIRMDNRRRFYFYQWENGKMEWLSEEIVWHLRGLGGDGLVGYSPIGLMRRAVGLGMDAEAFGARFFQNDARPGIILEHPGLLSKDAHKKVRDSWEERHKSVEKSHRPAILEEGMKLHEVGIPPDDAQFLETRKFQLNEIARVFRIPPHMIGDLDRATFSNIEHQSIEFVVHTIRPWLVRWEQSINQNILLSQDRQRDYYVEFLVDGLLRGDTQSRYQAYAQARQNGWMSANDIRELENMNPVEGGDVYLVPLNMIPAPQAGTGAEGQNSTREQRENHHPLAENRSAMMRYRLRGSFLEVYRDTAARILRREAYDIGAQASKTLRTRGTTDFLIWLDEFYREHADFIKRNMSPVNHTYGEAVAAEAMDEISQEFEMTPELLRFIDSYTGTFAARHIGQSQERLRAALARAQQEQMDPEEALEEEMSTWEESRAAGIAEEESTRLNNALAKTIFVLGGIKFLKSVAIGDSCVFCKALNGKVVGVTEYFLGAGETLNPDGAERPLTSNSNKGHPPYHGGCDCMVTASV